MFNSALIVNGKNTASLSKRVFTRKNPLDNEIATTAPAAGHDDAILALEAAQSALGAWAELGPTARRRLLNRVAQALEDKVTEFATAMAAETGASAQWAGFNVHLAADMFREAAALTTQIAGEVIPSDIPGSVALATRTAAGVVLGIAPWNAPVILAARAIAVPLACGNTVILKGSEWSPYTHFLVASACKDAGLPEGVVNYLTNAPEDAPSLMQTLIAHPSIRRVNFTGSTRIGRIIAQLCAEHLKPAVLELGGKAPLIVLDDADLPAAVAAATFGAFANSGQICMSTERIIVDARIADDFVAQLGRRVASLPIGDPRNLAAGPKVLGSVADITTLERCNALIEDALSKGATLVCGGKSRSIIMHGTVLDNVTPEMRIYHEESFGPVKPVVRVVGEEAALACANDNEYGLSASVFSQDTARAWRVSQKIKSGICHINGPTVHDEAQMPFGGTKSSGYGRFGGKSGIDAFTELRWITLQTQARHYPF